MPGLHELMMAGWKVLGPVRIEDNGQVHWEIRIEELPDFMVAGATQLEAIEEFLPALEAFLEATVEAGDPVPVPATPRWLFRLAGPEVPLAATSSNKPHGDLVTC